MQYNDIATGMLPPVMADPTVLPKAVKKKNALKKSDKAAPPSAPWRVPIHVQLGREFLNGLRGEINAAEPVLSNVYDDMSLFQTREGALNDILELLLAMRNCVDIVVAMPGEQDFIRNFLDNLISEIDRLARDTRHRSMSLLQPIEKLSPIGAETAAANLDIVFLIDRDPWMRKEAEALARNISLLHGALINRGLNPQFGVQPFEKYSQSSGPLRDGAVDVASDIASVYFEGQVRNSLTAIVQALGDQTFRRGAKKIIVMFCNGEPHDDSEEARDEALNSLKSDGASFFLIGRFNPVTGRPHSSYSDLASATSGACFSFEKTPMEQALIELANAISANAMADGGGTIESEERHIVIGPGPADTLNVKFPDFRAKSLGLAELPLGNEEDFKAALQRIQTAISTVSEDRLEKNIFMNYLGRIIRYFDDARNFRLDFKV